MLSQVASAHSKYRMSPQLLLLFVSVYILLTGNHSFFQALLDVYPVAENGLFVVVVSLVLSSLIYIVGLVSNFFLPVKVVAYLFLWIACFAGFFADSFGVVISVDMIRNSVETNSAEAADLLSTALLLHVLAYAIFPSLIVYVMPLKNDRAGLGDWRVALRNIAIIVIVLVSNTAIIWTQGNQFASFIREHKSVRYYANPLTPIHSAVKYLSKQLHSAKAAQFSTISEYAQTAVIEGHRELIIMVVGETARADHFSLNGYERQTNPRLSAIDRVISFSDFNACGTSTAISVPCMFAKAGRRDFDNEEARNTENALDVLAKAGVNVLWRDNNSDSKGVADRVTYQDFRDPQNNPECDIECRDIGMLDGLQEYVDSHTGDVVIVLHQMGSHGPAYYKRYPPEFEQYTPACQSGELAQCDRQSIINAYDNSILYTDYFLSKVIGFLKDNTPEFETTMMYVSDHGESLGENGIYLHGLPYAFAPEAQTKVPVLLWIGDTSDVDYSQTAELADLPQSHDSVFETLLTLFEVQSDAYPEQNRPLLIMNEEY